MKLNPLPASKLDPERPRPGIYLHVPFEQYAATKAFNNSKMGVLVETQAWSEVRVQASGDETVSTRFGAMFHQAYLEPLLFARKVAFGGPVNPKTEREYGRDTKVWQEFREQAEKDGKIILAREDQDHFAKMILSARHNPHARRVLGSKTALREVTMIAELPFQTIEGESGSVLVKCRPDILDPGTGKIPDMKTTEKPISPLELGRSFANFGYYRQASLYMDVAEVLTGEKWEPRWIIIKRCPPYDCVVATLQDEALTLGRSEYRTMLPDYAKCLESGWWPAYGGYWSGGEKRIAVVTVELPRWKLARFADGE